MTHREFCTMHRDMHILYMSSALRNVFMEMRPIKIEIMHIFIKSEFKIKSRIDLKSIDIILD